MPTIHEIPLKQYDGQTNLSKFNTPMWISTQDPSQIYSDDLISYSSNIFAFNSPSQTFITTNQGITLHLL